ncbi:MAG: ADOP family duplicated permease [Vicinamibacterales bacterium]
MITRLVEAWRRLRAQPHRAALEHGMDEEIRFHLDQQTEKNIRAGLPPDEARRQAVLRFGAVERTREQTRDQFRFVRLEDLWRDLRHGARSLARARSFTIIATLTLALGIGATTAMFSVVNGVLLRPLPYPDQDRLIELVHEAPAVGIDQLYACPAVYFGYRDHSRTFESVGLWDWDGSPVTVTGAGEPQSVESVQVTHEVLPMLGATPVLGRTFSLRDDEPGSAPTVLISYGYWQRQFGGADPLGRTLVVDGVSREIVGVLPASFRFFDYPADLFYPLQPVRADAAFPAGDGRGIARLKPGVTLAQANADAARLVPILDEEYPGGDAVQFGFQPKFRLLRDSVVGNLGGTLWLLMATIGVLLVIACANVSNLMLVRTQARAPELGLRAALGAGRGAIARVVVAESVLLGAAGGALGVAIAYLSLPLLVSLGAGDLPGIMTVAIDPRVLALALGMSVVATLFFALLPLVQFAWPRLPVTDALRGSGRTVAGHRESQRARHALVVGQVALALVLLVGSGLMIRSFLLLRQVDPGFREPESLQTFLLTIPPAMVAAPGRPGQHDAARTLDMQQQILERLESLPGVASAGFASSNDGLPLDGDGRSASIVAEGGATREDTGPFKEVQAVSPGFFEAFQTPLLAGRAFGWDDVLRQRPVALVSANFARAEWGSAQAALGHRIGPGREGPWWEVVGVVSDVHHDGLNQPPPETVIMPAFARNTTAAFVVRSPRAGTTAFLDEVRRAVWSVNPNLSLASVRTMGEMYRRSMARTTMTLQLLAITGTMALLLGLVGIYGIVSHGVAERRREIGIRLALGARLGEVRASFVRHALWLAVAGVALGLVAAGWLTRFMASQLFGVSPLDPLTLGMVAAILLLAAAVASYVPLRRLATLDPADVLRAE